MAKKPQQTIEQSVQDNLPTSSFVPSDDVLNAVISQQRSAAAACLQIFMKMAAGNTPTGDELTLLYSQGYDNKFAIQREVDKRRVTLELKAAAKTRAEREEFRKRVEAATAAFNAEAPGIEEEIREFVRVKQARVDELKRAITEPQVQLEAAETAVNALKTEAQLPKEAETTYRALRGRVHENFADFRRAESVANSMRGQLALADRLTGYVGKHNLEVPNDLRDLMNREALHGEGGLVVNAVKLAQHREKTERRLREAEAIINRDRDNFVQQMADVEKAREFWIE